MSLSENWIMKVFQDQNGRMLIGTFGEGLNIFNLPSYGFKHRLNVSLYNEINSFAETSDEKVWFHTTDHFLHYIDNHNLVHKSSIKIEDDITNIIVGKNGYLWLVSTTNNLYSVNIENSEINTFKNWRAEANLSIYNKLFHTNTNDKSMLWFIDNNNNLTAFDPIKVEFNRFKLVDQEVSLHGLVLEKEFLWSISSKNQLIKFNLQDYTFDKSEIKSNRIFPVEDISDMVISKNWIWFTSNHGVMLYNRNSKNIKIFNESNKLKNNNTLGLLIDSKENAWISSDSAISFINPKTFEIKNYGASFNLTDSQFITGSSIETNNNYMFFG